MYFITANYKRALKEIKMNTIELITDQQKQLFSAIKSNMALFSIHQDDDNKEALSLILEKMSSLCEKVHEQIIKKKINITDDEFKIFTKSKKAKETEYYSFFPHMPVGYSPFMFYKKKNKIAGMFISMQQVKFLWCTNTLKKLAREYFNDQYKKETPVSMKDAKLYIRNRLDASNPDNVPLLKKVSQIFFYYDIENSRVMAKSGHRDQDALSMFSPVLMTILDNETLSPSFKLNDDMRSALSNRFYTTPYARHAIATGKAYSAYNISTLVEHFSQNDIDITDGCPLTPTWTARFLSIHDNSQSISFKNSISIMIGDVPEGAEASFDYINQFSKGNDLSITQLKVQGELNKGEFLQSYCDEHGADNQLDGDFYNNYIDVEYTTQSKEGNLCLQITDPLPLHKTALIGFLKEHVKDTHLSKADFELNVLEKQGHVLHVLHQSIELFTTMYLLCSKEKEEFGKESDLEKALTQTHEVKTEEVEVEVE